MDPQELERDAKAIFARLPAVEAPPFLAGRVLALTLEGRRGRKEVLLWRWVAALSCTAMLAYFVVLHAPTSRESLLADTSYVIHLNLDDAEMRLASSAEVELPDGVEFVSSDAAVRGLRRLRLPVDAADVGRNRLPFVVMSNRAGTLPLQVRIYNANDELIQTKILTLHFERRS